MKLRGALSLMVTALFIASGAALPAQAADVTISGSITSSNGSAGSGWVAFYDNCEDYPVISTGFNAGAYSLTLPTGLYRVHIQPAAGSGAVDSWHNAKANCGAADTVNVSAAGTVNLVARAGSNITGSVSSSNGTVSFGEVYYYADCAAWNDGVEAAYGYIESGTYSLTVPNGSYKARVYPDAGTGALTSWHNAKADCASADTVSVSGNGTRNLTAIAGSNVTGSVTSSNGAVASGEVDFYANCDDWEAYEETASSDIHSGTYTVTVPNGSFLVRISPDPGTGAVESWHNTKGDCASADTVTVGGHGTQHLIARSGSDISGTVTSSNGSVGQGFIAFYTDCAAWNNGEAAAYAYLDGSFTTTLVDGTYKARIYVSSENAVSSWHAAKRDCASADPITVSGSGTHNLTVIAGYPVTGTVASGRGAVDAAEVEFYSSCDDYENGDAVDYGWFENGQPFSVTLPAGTYRVMISPDDSDTSGAFRSWHYAEATCASARIVPINGATTLSLVAAPAPAAQPVVTPPPPPPPPAATTAPSAQVTTFSITKLQRKQKKALPKRTSQGTPLTWKSVTKTCKVKKGKVVAVKKGKCKLRATAPAVTGFTAYAQTFTIKVK